MTATELCVQKNPFIESRTGIGICGRTDTGNLFICSPPEWECLGVCKKADTKNLPCGSPTEWQGIEVCTKPDAGTLHGGSPPELRSDKFCKGYYVGG